MKWKLGVLGGLLLAGANAMACYTVYDGSNRVVYRGTEAPVDMSLPLHQALQRARYPAGSSMVFDQAQVCAPVSMTEVARPSGGMVPANTIRREGSGRQAPPSSTAPLFTDRATAQASGLPHTVVAGNIAMVPSQAAARLDLPTFTVIPADPAVAMARAPARPDTTAMGAGPARQQTVITEMRDPPMTIIQRGNAVSVQR